MLNKQKIQVPLSALNESVDDKMLPEGSFTVLENAEFDKLGRISKRRGFEALSKTQDNGGDSISTGKSLVSTSDTLLLLDGKDAWTRRGSDSSWNYTNSFISCSTTITDFYGSEEDKVILDATSNDDGTVEGIVYVGKDDQNLGLIIVDIASGTIIHNVQIPDLEVYTASLVYGGGYFNFAFTVYSGSGVAVGVQLNQYSELGTVGASGVTLLNDINTTKKAVQVVKVNATTLCAVAETNTSGGQIEANLVSFADPATSIATTTLAYTSNAGEFSVCVNPNSEDIYVATIISGGNVRIAALDSTTLATNYSRNQSLSAVIPTVPIRLSTGFGYLYGGYNYILGYEFVQSGPPDINYVEFNACSETLDWFYPSASLSWYGKVAGAFLASQIMSRTEDGLLVPYCVLGYKEDDTQNSYFLAKLRDDAPYGGGKEHSMLVASKFLMLEAGERPERPVLPTFASETSFICTKKTISSVVDEAPTVNSLTAEQSIQRVAFDFEVANPSTVLDGTTYIAGGPLRYFDGAYTFSADYNNMPVISEYAQATTGGNIDDGQYQYKAVYETVDSRGNVVRSAPSLPLTVTVTAGTGTATIDLRCHEPFLLERSKINLQSPFHRLQVKIYRTTNLGSIFYLVKQSEHDTVLTDDINDSDITDEEIIYTQGGELENLNIPSVSIIETYKNRLWVAGADEKRILYFSKQIVSGEVPGFSSLLSKTYPNEITAIAAMGDNLYIFSENTVSFITGEGPNALGINDNLSDFISVSSTIGCTNSRSVVKTDDGIYFQSDQGIYLLSNGAGLIFVGSQIKDTVSSSTITKTINVPSRQEIKFLAGSQTILVFNYEFKTWSKHVLGVSVVDMAVLDGLTYLLASDGTVYKENATTHQDGDTDYSLKMTTGWINLSNLNQLHRVYDIYLIGNYASAHTLNVKIAYDYDDTIVDTKTWDTSTGLTGGDTTYQIRIRPSRQKVEAVKITIYDSAQSGTSESYSINQLSFVVGVKGTNKQIASIKNI